MLSKKSSSGDLYIDLAMRHLENHEWGLARMAIHNGIAKGRLSEPDQACAILQDVYDRLGIRSRVSTT
ncbi:hypothetical protein OAE19_02245 [Porticoccaceae bacterium]|nr:hypothetical protein [Porticoccaceae bacterium]MDB9999184.1 hypothetical protein [Porticoccaceae bacterium]MDC0003196.1 hypothetical protein [Porticoccaceae bacterium]